MIRKNKNKNIEKYLNDFPILSVRNLKKSYGGIRALDGCSIDVAPNKITAIIGPNGSGKTTLFDAITGLIKIDSGKVILEKIDITKKNDFDIAKSGVSRTFQQVRLFKNLSIQDHIEIALDTQDEYLFKNLSNVLLRKKNDKIAKVKEILSIVGLDKPLSTNASDLSYGQRKLLDLAIAIAKPHNILLLDEPVAGVNPKLRSDIVLIIKKLKDSGETIILIEHDMNFVMDLADTVIVLGSGKLIAMGKPEEIQNNKKVLEAYLGD